MRLGFFSAALILGLSACCGCRSRCPDCDCPGGQCPAPQVEPTPKPQTKPNDGRPKLRPRGEIATDS